MEGKDCAASTAAEGADVSASFKTSALVPADFCSPFPGGVSKGVAGAAGLSSGFVGASGDSEGLATATHTLTIIFLNIEQIAKKDVGL